MRRVYGAQFSILQLNSVVLILHLSLAELLMTVVMIPAGGYLAIEGLGWEIRNQILLFMAMIIQTETKD